MNIFLLIALLIISGTYHQLLYFVIPITSLYYFSVNRKSKLVFNPFVKLYTSLFVVIILFFLIQTLLSFNIKIYSIKGVLRYFSYCIFALMIFNFKKETILKYFKYIILFLVFSLPIAIYQFQTIGRYQNFFSHANHLAYIIVISIYFLIAYKPFRKSLSYLLLLVLLLSLFLTKTSGAILILLFLGVFNFFATKKIRLRKKLFIVFGPVLIFTPIALNFSDKILSQIDSLDYLKWEFIMRRVDEFKPGGYGSFIWRIVYWLKIYFSFIEESFSKIFFGVGIDALTKGNMPYKYMYTDPHNDFLKVLVEYGFFGLALLINFIKNIYFTLQKNMDFIIILFVPMFFDNAIVNFSFNLTLILLFAYDYKKNIIEIN